MPQTREILLRHSRQTALAAARETNTQARTALLRLATEQLVIADTHWPEVATTGTEPDPFAPAPRPNGNGVSAPAP